MKSVKALLTLAPLVFSVDTIAQAHQHGTGTLYIAQEGNQWQLQFSLPASDVVGFEHEPETKQQAQRVNEKLTQLLADHQLFIIPDSCELVSQQSDVPDFLSQSFTMEDDHDDHHDGHDHDHEEHGDHEEHEHHEEHGHHDDHEEHDHHDNHKDHDEHGHEHHDDEASHQDVEATFTLSCTDKPKDFLFTIFETFPSVEKLEAMWAIQGAQGSQVITAGVKRVSL